MVEMRRFKGINNIKPAERLERDDNGAWELREAENVDIDNEFRVSRREGAASSLAGTNMHSLWSTPDGSAALFVEGSNLKKLNNDLTATTLASGLTPDRHMAYVYVNGDVYYTNGINKGVIAGGVNRTWGVELPIVQPSLAAASGALHAGIYQVVLTYERLDGEESGAGASNSVTLSSTGGITVSGIPTSSDSDVAYVNIYCSAANGDVLYFAGRVSNGTAVLTISVHTFTIPLKTQFVSPPLAGSILEEHSGRIYVSVGDAVYFSDPFAYGHFRLATSYLQFPEDVTMMGSVTDGMFFSADKTYFQNGSNPLETSMVDRSESIAIKNTMVYVDGAKIEGVGTGPAIMWASNRGIYAGGSNGALRNLTEESWSFATADTGSGLIREKDGSVHYIGLLKDTDDTANNAYAGDVVTAEIQKQGVT